jgi:2-polyprenyl-3-methyl-5-hydroxy-6-metoxy-1,4-benzoquinol methylase
MIPVTTAIPPCHICGGQHIVFFSEKNGFRMYQCMNCDLMFVSPMPTSQDLAAMYTEEYFKNIDKKDSHGYTDYDRDKEPMRRAFVRALQKIESRTQGRTIFDVGAATGYFLDVAKTRGWKTKGSEISQYGAEVASRRGHEMMYGDLPTMPNLPVVDAVTMWDVLEHLPDPRSFCKTINKMLPVGGIFVINTPDKMSRWARLLGKRWQLIVPPEHVHYYAPKNIKILLEQCGFEVVEISRMGKTFSLPYVFKMLWSWQRLWIWNWLAKLSDNPVLRRVKLPINLRDNMFVLARKVHD